MAKDDFRGKPLDDGLRGQISETDRAEIYRKVREGIDEILNGGGSYYADGPQRDEFEIGSDLDEFGQFVRGLTTHFGDSD